ncbi:hypothetical protein PLESTB_000210800 [Pleodorina starrii]|uniref:VHS domain-containing protein n=1 Tax=Pleodorina starrii TaxID=330485 RepID=A0A9W6BD41_9CHLO|nr:hypothetical protein PLESTB_000210800 [Pleodorina starrii]
MAAKIKEGLRDITHGVVERLKGGPKYADNLLGESLQDQLRKATGKELTGPNEELTSQVVDTINQDIANGKDSKEIVVLLKKRLRTDNPHKQWLAVLLVGRVMRDCSAALAPHQEELLQEVARVMTRPAKQDSGAGKTTRQAAKELLRSYGRAGTSAFRAVTRPTLESGASAEQVAAAINAAVAREAAQVVAEVNSLIEQAQANTELLSEMLLVAEQQQQQQNGAQAGGQAGPSSGGGGGGGGGGGDEFENELTRELVTEVRELRTLFDAYLEQLQTMAASGGEPGVEVEAVIIRALEAVDMLDGALSLQKDVACNQRELEQRATAAAGPSAAGPSATLRDLISLDDLAEALLPQPPPVLAGNPAEAAAAATGPAAAAAAAAGGGATRPAPVDPFAALDPIAVQAVLSPSSSQPQPANPASQPPAASQPPYTHPYGGAYPQYPHQHSQPQPYGMYGAPAAAASAGNPFAASAVPAPPYSAVTQPAAAAPPPPGVTPAGNPFEAAAAGGGGGGNPFAAAVATASTAAAAQPAAASGGGNAAAMDSEWAMFFANRTSAAAPPQQQQQQQH